jgi:hypothetical protein
MTQKAGARTKVDRRRLSISMKATSAGQIKTSLMRGTSSPETWLGDQSAAGYLTFELSQSAIDGIQNNVPYNVALSAPGSRPIPGGGQSEHRIPRYGPSVETEGWLKAGRDQPPTQSEMLACCPIWRTADYMEFRGDEDTGCLNRVALYSAGAPVYQQE